MPSACVVTGRNGITDATLNLNAENEGMQNGLPWQPALFAKGDGRWCNRCRRMDDRPQVCVVVIEQVSADGVEERGTKRIELLTTADQRDPVRPLRDVHKWDTAVRLPIDMAFGAAPAEPG